MKFKPGDRIVCVRGNSAVHEGKTYTFAKYVETGDELLYIEENDRGYFASRFRMDEKARIENILKYYNE